MCIIACLANVSIQFLESRANGTPIRACAAGDKLSIVALNPRKTESAKTPRDHRYLHLLTLAGKITGAPTPFPEADRTVNFS